MNPIPEPSLRRAPIPLREPRAAASVNPRGTAPVPATQGTLALALPWEAPAAISRRSSAQPPAGPSAQRPAQRPPRRSAQPAAGPSALPQPAHPGTAPDWVPGTQGSSRGPVGVLPEPRYWAASFVLAAMEVATGLRSPAQLVRWTSPDVHAALSRRGALTARAARRTGAQTTKPQLRTLVLGSPGQRIYEVAAVLAGAEKVRAVAFRMEGFQGRWRVTVMEIG